MYDDCMMGDDALLAEIEREVCGDDVPSWDASAAYSTGSVVMYWNAYYRARQDIPAAGWFSSNDAPDQSGAWARIASPIVSGEDVIPRVGQNYTDPGTVRAVQTALEAHGFHLKKGVDGVFGPDTAQAIRAMQASAGIPQTGVIDEGVIAALKVTPSVQVSYVQHDNAAPTTPVAAGVAVPKWKVVVGALGAAIGMTGVVLLVTRR